MPVTGPARVALSDRGTLSDEEIVSRVLGGERPLFELLMRRYNERIYRTVRSVLRDDAEAEDAMQQAYVDAFQHLGDFAGRARFSTWLTRIALNEALARRRRNHPEVAGDEAMEPVADPRRSPEQRASDGELQRILADAIDQLPEHYRTVFVLRAVQGLSIDETAESLDLNEDTVKTRLHRARHLLQSAILLRTEPQLESALPFPATRCDRVVAAVLQRLGVTP
jgi:RNA polymerase sigma-70 factor (ECF subfamily)